MKLGSHHSILLISKKLNRLKVDNSSWIHKREGDTRQTTVPKIGETDGQIQGVLASQSRNSQAETTLGSKTLNGR